MRGPGGRAARRHGGVPVIFPAGRVDGRRLIDGVISDPLPLSAAIDAVAVITLGFDGDMPRRINRPSRLFGQVSTALLHNLT
jgi:NTE family protein